MNMALEINGKLIQKLELQSGMSKSGSNWQKQEFIIETDEQYPKKICANLWGDKIDMLSSINIGDDVVLSFNLESREYNGKWYTDVKAWKLEKQSVNQAPTQSSPDTIPMPSDSDDFLSISAEDDVNDLPF